MLNLFQHGSFSPSLLKKQGDFSVVLTGSNGACGRDLLAEDPNMTGSVWSFYLSVVSTVSL
jgi:hypothetical protein